MNADVSSMAPPQARRGRPREFDLDKALHAAMNVFWDKGYDGAQVADLTAAMGINAASFYAAFKAKERLFREVFALYVNLAEQRMAGFRDAATAKSALRALLEASADTACSAPGARGCMLVLGITNCIPANAPLRELVLQQRMKTGERLRARLALGVAEGDLPLETDIEQFSRFFAGIIQALSLQARDGATRAELQAFIDTALGTLHNSGMT